MAKPREPAKAADHDPRFLAASAQSPVTVSCAVHDAMKVLQGKWTLQIIGALLAGPRGFNDLARAVGGCNPATLSRRLEALAELGLLTKRVDSTMPPRTCYTATPAGLALADVVSAIQRWGEAHLPDATEPDRSKTLTWSETR